MKGQEKGEETAENDVAAQQTEAADPDPDPDPEITGGSELTDSVTGNPEPTAASEKER